MTPKANLVVILGALLIVITLWRAPQFSNLKSLIIKGNFSAKDVTTTSSPIEFVGIGLVLLVVLGVVANMGNTAANIILIIEGSYGVISLANGKL